MSVILHIKTEVKALCTDLMVPQGGADHIGILKP